MIRGLHDFIKQVKDRGVTLWLHIHSENYGPSDPSVMQFVFPFFRNLLILLMNYNVRTCSVPALKVLA